MNLEVEIKKIVENTVRDILIASPPIPELITISQTAEICGVNRSVIDSLIKERELNNFPAVKFSAQSIKIDRRRLFIWIERGGLT